MNLVANSIKFPSPHAPHARSAPLRWPLPGFCQQAPEPVSSTTCLVMEAKEKKKRKCSPRFNVKCVILIVRQWSSTNVMETPLHAISRPALQTKSSPSSGGMVKMGRRPGIQSSLLHGSLPRTIPFFAKEATLQQIRHHRQPSRRAQEERYHRQFHLNASSHHGPQRPHQSSIRH